MGAEITAAAGGRYVLLVENRTGYQNLCRLITSMKLRSAKGTAAASEAEFRQYSKGLICMADGSQPLETLLDIYDAGNVYAEIQRHRIRSEEVSNQYVIELARQWKLPLVASNGVRYAYPKNRCLMDVLTCTRHKTNVAEAGRLLEQNTEHYLKPAAAMRRLFAICPMPSIKGLNCPAVCNSRWPIWAMNSPDTPSLRARPWTLSSARERWPEHWTATAHVTKEHTVRSSANWLSLKNSSCLAIS